MPQAILRQALCEAVRDGLLDDNVAARARPPGSSSAPPVVPSWAPPRPVAAVH